MEIELRKVKLTSERQLEEKANALERLDREKSESFRRQVKCRTCTSIYLDPIDLLCLNTICKSHFEDFNKSGCSFCHQYHEMSLNEVKHNQSLSEILQMNLHLSEKEKQIKMEIEKLLEKNKSLTEELKQNEAQSDALCYDHFAQIENRIDLQREELESDFRKEMRQIQFPLENLEQIKKNLTDNSSCLNDKLIQIKSLSDNIKKCMFLVKNIDFDMKIYGEINLVQVN